jgi:hypothetical protein
MKFLPYEDVPLYLSVNGQDGEYIFAEQANLSVSHDLAVSRQLDDNIIQICEYGVGSSMQYSPVPFSANSSFFCTLGPTKGPPRPLATSIFKIPSGTEVTFPNNKHLYFTKDVMPDGKDYVIELESKSGNWSLTEDEAQNGYFEPIYNYVSQGPLRGKLDVNFYPNTGNLQSFFNITGLSDPLAYPPIDEEKITGHFGEFIFNDAYLNSFSFSISPNSIIQASASFDIFGELQQDSDLLDTYYASADYSQKSIPHGNNSQIVGHSSLGMNHAIGFSYQITVNRQPSYHAPTGAEQDVGLVPHRVSKGSTTISMSLEGDNLDPNILSDGFNGERANLSAILSDLNYQNFDDNSNGIMNTFTCNGVVTSQSLSVSSQGYLNGSISVVQNLI